MSCPCLSAFAGALEQDNFVCSSWKATLPQHRIRTRLQQDSGEHRGANERGNCEPANDDPRGSR